MAEVSFLNDDECLEAIVHLTTETAKIWAPDEVDLVDVVAHEYLRQVRAAGRILYPARVGNQALDLGISELVLLVILPIVTNLIADLLLWAGARTLKELVLRVGQRLAAEEVGGKPEAILPGPELIRALIEQRAPARGISPRQVEQLAQLFADVMRELLAADDQGTVSHAGSLC